MKAVRIREAHVIELLDVEEPHIEQKNQVKIKI